MWVKRPSRLELIMSMSEHVVRSIADVLHVSPDTLYEQAGMSRNSDGPSKVIEAIREDPHLTGRQRRALIEVYDAFTRSRRWRR